MKRGTTPTLKLEVDIDLSLVDNIDFILKQTCNENCEIKVTKHYPSEDVDIDEDGYFLISFTEEETRTFKENNYLFLDTKITLTNGKIPETNILSYKMNATLFKEGE